MSLVPDRQSESRTSTVADVIDRANEVRLESCGRRHHRWVARIGPRGRGLEGTGRTPREAVEALLDECEVKGWVFDETWTESTQTGPGGQHE